MHSKTKALFFSTVCFLLCCVAGCTRPKTSTATSAFYYWKTTFHLDKGQDTLLKKVAGNRLYLRFFDVAWDELSQQAIPNAIVSIKEQVKGLKICPVVYLTNKTFEHTPVSKTDSLAFKVNELVRKLAAENQISYESVQLDCDWSLGTRESYFSFLKSLKKYSNKKLEATIRLHQIKYFARTGVPPVEKGLLMFYNMGKILPDLKAPNSIYNAADAAKYLNSLKNYVLPLDVALPVFSWTLQIRSGKVIQVYAQIDRKKLSDHSRFLYTGTKNVHQAIRSFYMDGIYIKRGDFFKFEEISPLTLDNAARQLSSHLAPLEKRNIIYYELSTIHLPEFQEKDFQEVSAHF